MYFYNTLNSLRLNPLTPELPVTARTRLHCFNFLNRMNIALTISCHHSSPSNLDTQ